MIITIDGPSGTGKSTVAKNLAKVLGITYFDTGALYRAATITTVAQIGIALESAAAASQLITVLVSPNGNVI